MTADTKYYSEFSTKRELLDWIDEHINEIDFDKGDVRIEFYPNEYN